MRLYLITTAGYPNFGDEMVLKGWLEYIANLAIDAEIWVDCHHPDTVSRLLGPSFSHVRFTDFIWRTTLEASVESALGSLDFGLKAWNHIEPLLDQFPQASSALLSADIAHLMGTGFINEIWPSHFAIPALIASAPYTNLYTCKILTGTGFMPLRKSTLGALAFVLSQFDYVDLRDQITFDVLRHSKVIPPCKLSMTGDDSFLLNLRPSIRLEPRLDLCIQGDFWEDVDQDVLVEEICRIVIELSVADQRKIRMYELIPGTDRKFLDAISQRCRIDEFRDFQTNFEDGLDIAPDDIVISSRFHMHLLAARIGARGLWLNPKSGYYDIKHRAAVQSGSRWPEFKLKHNEAVPYMVKPNELRMKRMQRLKTGFARRIYQRKPWEK